MRRASLVALALLGPACWADAEDNGEVCVVPPGVNAMNDGAPPGPHEYAEDEIVIAYVLVNDSNEVRDIACSITRDGDRLVIHTSYEYKRSGLGATGLVRHSYWLCMSEPLPAGTYNIEYGTAERTLTIPSEVEAPCLSPRE